MPDPGEAVTRESIMSETTTKGSAEGDRDRKERDKALALTISQIDKQVGKGSIIRLGDSTGRVHHTEVVSSGSLGLDLALGVGGIPRGRVIEVFGPESSGKTTLTLGMIASVQRAGGTAVFIDAEHALQPSYARLLGVDTENLYVSQPDTGEDALEIADQLVRSGAVDIVVIDSVAALVPRSEIEGDMGDAHVGLQARLMSQALRKLTGSISRSKTIVVFINQIRMKIGVMFGNPETTTGGNALKFYSSLRLDIRRIGSIKQGDEVIGNRTRVRVVKNKVAAPFKSAEFDIVFDEGISRTGELIDLGLETGLLEKSGSWLSYGTERLGQGREQARQTLRENKEMAARLEHEIRVASGLLPADEARGNGKDQPDSAAGAAAVLDAKASTGTAAPAGKGDPPAGGKGPAATGTKPAPEVAKVRDRAAGQRDRRTGAGGRA